MTEAVNLRERVKEPPSPLLVESYYRGSVARAQHQPMGQMHPHFMLKDMMLRPRD